MCGKTAVSNDNSVIISRFHWYLFIGNTCSF